MAGHNHQVCMTGTMKIFYAKKQFSVVVAHLLSRRMKVSQANDGRKSCSDNLIGCPLGSSDFDIFLEIQYASCVFGLALKS
jgi:hypothetical protein